MSDGRWVKTILIGIVIGNLIVLTKFFMVPRMQFLLAHKDLPRNQWMATSASRDMPNQRTRTYAVAHRIQELTPIDATLFMPPGDRTKGSFRSATIQVLYPRKIIFGDEKNFQKELKTAKQAETVFFVYSPDWQPDFCEQSSRIELTDFGFGMCRLAP